MLRFRYRTFVWVFTVANAVVWFGILYGLGRFLHAHLAVGGQLSSDAAARVICVGIVLPLLLSLQGAIVNLRAQFLIGRFGPPDRRARAGAVVRNPWSVAALAALLFAAIAFPILYPAVIGALPARLDASHFAIVFAAVGACCTFGLVLLIADHEFYPYLSAVRQPPPAAVPLRRYLLCNIALPWAVVNCVINGVLAWLIYRGGHVSWMDLRQDLVVMAFLISVFMALSAIPEAETDFVRRHVRIAGELPTMPRLWTRYGYAAGTAAVVYVTGTALAAVLHINAVPLWAVIIIKAVLAGVIAGGASAACALWALSRCAQRHSARAPAVTRAVVV